MSGTSLFVLAYPNLCRSDKAFIDAYRRKHDLAYADVVEPHFTLVFGCKEISRQALCDHVRGVALRLQPIQFVCRYAMLGVDHASTTGHVFLVPDEGFSAFSLCHDKLYEDLLKPHHRLDIPFVPHIAIGTLPSLEEAKRLCDQLNRDELKFAGRVETLTVSALVDNKIKDVEQYALAGR